MSHLAGEMFKMMAHIDMVHVPYKGGGPALTDVVAGVVPLYLSGVNSALPFIKAGQLRALAVTGARRSKPLPDVPTVAETPGFEGCEVTVGTGVWVPAKTPAAIVEKLNAAVVAVTHSKDFSSWLESDGSEPVGNSSKEMRTVEGAEIKKLAEVIKATDIKVR
jgi:tripartite-type tricarboxylate transporter receptor subunit TctC